MNNKNIIIAGAIAIGLYLFSQTKKIRYTTTAQKVAQRIRSTATPTIRQRTAQKVAQKIAQKVAQKVAPKRIGQPTTQAARIAAARKAAAQRAAAQRAAAQRAAAQRAAAQRAAAQRAAAQKVDISKLPVKQLRYMIAHAATQKKTGKEVVALKAEVARREAAYIAAIRKAAAQKIGKKIGKTVAQKVTQKKVASWKAPYRFPKSRFRVITPSNLLKNLAKKDIARKKASQQKKVQKTTPGTPSDRRKSRLEALYGSHWHDIWIQRQKRR